MAKNILFVKLGGQSNFGTDPNMGRVDYADMPAYLKPASTKILMYAINLNVGPEPVQFNTYIPQSDRQMGQIDQFLYRMSKLYTKIYVVKRAVGGTTLADSVAMYPRSDFKNRVNAAESELITLEGIGTYGIAMLWGQMESDGIVEADSLAYGDNLQEWFIEESTETFLAPRAFRRISDRQTDFEFRANVKSGQNTVASLSRYNNIFNSDDLTMAEDGDFSHLGPAGAIVGGNRYADIIENIVGKYGDKTRPRLVSAVIEESNRYNIVLTFNKNINPVTLPFWLDFSVSPTRQVTAISVSGKTVTITVGFRFSVGEEITLSYTKNGYYGIAFQDYLGNEVADFTAFPVTNNVTSSAPTETPVYASDFTAGTDGFLALSGATVTGAETIGGETDCLKYLSDGGDLIYRSPTLTIGHTYRLKYRAYWDSTIEPDNIDDSVSVQGIAYLIQNMAPLIVTQEWMDFDIEFTASGSNQLRFQMAGVVPGSVLGIKGIDLKRLT